MAKAARKGQRGAWDKGKLRSGQGGPKMGFFRGATGSRAHTRHARTKNKEEKKDK